jgi:hypothetical protein
MYFHSTWYRNEVGDTYNCAVGCEKACEIGMRRKEV